MVAKPRRSVTSAPPWSGVPSPCAKQVWRDRLAASVQEIRKECESGPSLANNAVIVAIIHVRVGGMPDVNGRNAVSARL